MAYIPLNINSNVHIETHDATGDLGTGHIISAYVNTDAPVGEQLTYLVVFDEKSRRPMLINETALFVDADEVPDTPDSGVYPA